MVRRMNMKGSGGVIGPSYGPLGASLSLTHLSGDAFSRPLFLGRLHVSAKLEMGHWSLGM